MSITLGAILAVAGIGSVVSAVVKNAADMKRQSIPCNFSNGISRDDFNSIVYSEAQRIKRVTIKSVDGPVIKGEVTSNSGITSWNFTIDFNDHGLISGHYWITKDNDDSKIPETLASRISSKIYQKLVPPLYPV